MKRLSIKEEKFCQEYLKGSATDAYKAAYNCGEATKEATIVNNAYNLAKKPKIQARIKELQEEIKRNTAYTLTDSFENLKLLQQQALDRNDIKAAIRCEELKGKMCGLYNNSISLSANNTITEIKINVVKNEN